jgi:hypothetical protein
MPRGVYDREKVSRRAKDKPSPPPSPPPQPPSSPPSRRWKLAAQGTSAFYNDARLALLAAGWEPFAVDQGVMFFRKEV